MAVSSVALRVSLSACLSQVLYTVDICWQSGICGGVPNTDLSNIPRCHVERLHYYAETATECGTVKPANVDSTGT